MDWRRPLDRLDLNHDQRIDDQVNSEGVIEVEAVVVERNQPLSLHAQAATLQIAGKNRFIDGFQQARPETDMQLVGRIHNLAGDGI